MCSSQTSFKNSCVLCSHLRDQTWFSQQHLDGNQLRTRGQPIWCYAQNREKGKQIHRLLISALRVRNMLVLVENQVVAMPVVQPLSSIKAVVPGTFFCFEIPIYWCWNEWNLGLPQFLMPPCPCTNTILQWLSKGYTTSCHEKQAGVCFRRGEFKLQSLWVAVSSYFHTAP